MAHARFGHDSDVYVYADSRGGYTCEPCPDVGQTFRCATAAAMADHLRSEHMAKGHRVPADAIEELVSIVRRTNSFTSSYTVRFPGIRGGSPQCIGRSSRGIRLSRTLSSGLES